MALIAGYDNVQVGNAAIIADVARAHGLGERGALLGVMCAMGESSLRNIDYGDWETNGVRNPDGTPTTSIGLFQQQAWWGSPADRMDPIYAAWKFFDALNRVAGWRDLAPTVAIHRVQINADPNHYAKYETPARAVLAAIPDLRAKGLIVADPMQVIEIPWQPGMYAVRELVDKLIDAGRPRINSAHRVYQDQKDAWDAYQAGRGNPADNPDRPDLYELGHVRAIAVDIDVTPNNVRRLSEVGLVRPFSWEGWHWRLAGSVYRFPLLFSLPAVASIDAAPLPKTPTEEEELMAAKDEIVSAIGSKIDQLDTRRDTAIVWVDGSAFVVDDAGGTKWNAIRGQNSVQDAIRFIGWLRDRGFREYPAQAPWTLYGYRDITGEGSIREEVAAAIRELAPKAEPAAAGAVGA